MRTLFEPPTLGGVGSIVTSCAYVCREEHPNPRMLGVYDDSFLPERSGPPGALIRQWQADPEKKPRCVSCGRCVQTEGKNCVFHS